MSIYREILFGQMGSGWIDDDVSFGLELQDLADV